MIKYTEEGTWDVIVCGGGPSGISAAVTTKRMGCKTLLLERYGVLGGAITSGHVLTMMGSVRRSSLRDEIASMLKSKSTDTAINAELAKIQFTKFLENEDVEFYLQTPVVEVLKRGEKIQGVLIQTQEGLKLLKAKIFIDATGDGYVAARAGAEVSVGRKEDGLVQPVSLMYTIKGVDIKSNVYCFHEEHDTVLADGRSYLQVCKDAEKSGELPKDVSIVRLYKTAHPDERLVNASQANGVNPLDLKSVSRAEVKLRWQIEKINEFLRKEIPGFENIYITASSSTLGVRESRRIRGRYMLTAEDLLKGRKFEDVVVHDASFPIDIHNPTGGGQSETDGIPYQVKPYDIPLRTLQPLGLKNLVLTGRSISGTHRAHASYRVLNIVLAIGQASGVLAALAQDYDSVHDVPYSDVEKELLNQGCKLR